MRFCQEACYRQTSQPWSTNFSATARSTQQCSQWQYAPTGAKSLLDPNGPRLIFWGFCKPFKRMAGTTGLEPAASAVTGQRSNQLNYVPNLFSYLYRKPASLLAFLRFNRFACVACFNPVEQNSEVNGHHGHQAKPSKTVLQANTNPEQLSLPRQ